MRKISLAFALAIIGALGLAFAPKAMPSSIGREALVDIHKHMENMGRFVSMEEDTLACDEARMADATFGVYFNEILKYTNLSEFRTANPEYDVYYLRAKFRKIVRLCARDGY
ncbi:MAG: hypothetical protein VYE46_04175 [Cyanobacteriota bacterium]|nr:hypothetical protein [Cyanobacteriota bacterium]